MHNFSPAVPFSRARALQFLAAHPRTPGICRQCGCTHFNPCRFQPANQLSDAQRIFRVTTIACGWTDATRTLCNNPACVAQAAATLERQTPAE